MAHSHHDDDQHAGCGCNAGRRDFLLDMLAAGGLAALGLSSAGPALAQPDDEVVRIGYIPITDATPLLVAHAEGYFADEGLEAAEPTLIRGWSPLVEAFASQRFNLVHLLKPIPIWMRYRNDFPVKIMGWAHINGSGVVAGRHVEAESIADLGGTQVAVPYWYSMHNVILQMALREAGLKPVIKSLSDELAPDEVNLSVLPPPEMPTALASRKIDAFIVAEPFNAAGELLAGGRMLRFTGDMWRNHPCCVLCMNENQVQQRPEWTQRVMNALVRAENHAQNDKREVARMLSRDGRGYLPMPAKVVERAMTHYGPANYPDAIQHDDWGSGRIDFNPWPYPSATRFIVDAMNRTLVGGDTTFLKEVDPAFAADDLVDYEFVRRAMEKYPVAGFSESANPWEREEVIRL